MSPFLVSALLAAIAVGVLSQSPPPAVGSAAALSPRPTAAQGDGLIHEAGRCSMKFQCGASSAPGGGFYDCVNNSLAEAVDNTTEFFALLQSTCPMLANVPEPKVCCDIAMVCRPCQQF